MSLWDAIVVGAGPAGCAAAFDLARAGCSVLLLDRAEFPRPKACAGGLTAKTLAALRYPVDPVVRKTIHAIVLEGAHSAPAKVASRSPICAMTVREELDAYCLAKTLAAGAVFQKTGRLDEVVEQADRVVVTAAGETLEARFLIGADGANSRVRALMGEAPWFRRGFALEVNLPCPDGGRDLVFDFAPVAGGYGWVFPKSGHLNIGLYCENTSQRIDRQRLLDYVGARLGEAAVAGPCMGQYLGLGAEDHRPESQRVLLVGDAGGFADALTGEGIYGAVVSGQAAAAAILLSLQENTGAAAHFAAATGPLRANLGIASRGARRFYAHPESGLRAMRVPFLRSVILHSYARGLDLARLARAARRFYPA